MVERSVRPPELLIHSVASAVEEPEQALMDLFGTEKTTAGEKVGSCKDLNVTAARWFTAAAAAAAINGSYTTSLNQIGAISSRKFPICRCSKAERGGGGGKTKARGENRRPIKKKKKKKRLIKQQKRLNLKTRRPRVTARTQANGRLVCLAAISQSQERLR